MQQVTKTAGTPVLSDLDLEVVSGGKTVLAQRVLTNMATPYLDLVGRQAGYTLGESVGRSLGS